MPYNPTTKLISGAIGIHDIAKALGAGRNEELRGHANTNLWTRCKPFRNSAQGFASTAALNTARTAANFGIGIPSAQGVNAPNTLLSTAKTLGLPDWNYTSVGRAWSYNAPRGTAYDEPFRLLDFDGYRVDDRFPFHDSALSMNGAMKYKIDVYGRAIATAPNLPQVRPDSLNESELTQTIGQWQTRHMGIVYRPQNSATGWECKTVEKGTAVISGLAAGTVYDAAFFICGKELANKGEITASDRFYLAPYPYFTLGDYQDFGFEPSVIGNAAVFPTSIALTLGYKCQTSGEYRRIREVKLCHRASSHYTQVTGNRYQITKLKSGVVADNEDDVVIYNGDPLMVPPTDTVQNFPPPQGGLAPLNTFTLNIDPSKVNEGATFLVFRHQHYTNNQWVDDMQGADGNAETTTLTGGGLYAIRLTYRLPIDPTQ